MSKFIFILLMLFFLPNMYINIGKIISSRTLANMFMLEKIVSDCDITPILCSKKWPASAIFIGAEPEIPPCQTISPEYPAAPIKG